MSENKNTFDDHVITWESPEYVQHEKGLIWFALAGLLMFAFGIYAAFTGNWTLVVALVLVCSVYIWQHGQTPKNVTVIISKTGIKIGEKAYAHQDIKNFWIIYHPPHVKTLNIRSNSKRFSDISIELGDQDPSELRTFLCGYIREDEGREEHLTDFLIRLLKI